uniref:Ricin B lectin domain-containing protein n=1 Tax=Sphaerisporangium sp. SANK 60911 TaxID=1354075 RepID=V5YS34_9ACTN|nr:hypothetical protein [Sphaerisporangium sp. SANK 60911]
MRDLVPHPAGAGDRTVETGDRMSEEIQLVNEHDGLVLDARHAIRPRARVQMFSRNDPPNRNQVWALDAAGRLRCGGPLGDLVLGLENGELRLIPVTDDRPDQQWDQADGAFVNRARPGEVLEVVPPYGREARLRLAAPTSEAAQRWTVLPVKDPSAIVEPGPWDGDIDD